MWAVVRRRTIIVLRASGAESGGRVSFLNFLLRELGGFLLLGCFGGARDLQEQICSWDMPPQIVFPSFMKEQC